MRSATSTTRIMVRLGRNLANVQVETPSTIEDFIALMLNVQMLVEEYEQASRGLSEMQIDRFIVETPSTIEDFIALMLNVQMLVEEYEQASRGLSEMQIDRFIVETPSTIEDFIALMLNVQMLVEEYEQASRGLSQMQIDRLPTTVVSLGNCDVTSNIYMFPLTSDADIPGSSTGAAHDSTAEDKCSICQDNFQEHQILRVIPCVHRYHKMCIDQWLIRNASCPVCRIKITVNNRGN